MEKTSTDTKMDYELVQKMLKAINEDQTKVGIQEFHDLCKAFTKISGSLGKLVAWGFEGTFCALHHRHPHQMQDSA